MDIEKIYAGTVTHHVKSMEHTNVTWPVTFAQPVIQLAKADHFGGASLAEK